MAFLSVPDTQGRPVLVALGPARRAAAWWPEEDWHPRDVAAAAFVPSRLPDFADRVASVYRLAPREAETLAAVLGEDSMITTAAALGLSEAGARKRLRLLFDALGERRLSEVLARVTRLIADETVADWAREEGLRAALDLTPAEARVAARLAEGLPLPDVARHCGVTVHTVRDQARALLARCGLTRLKDFSRFGSEALGLISLVASDNPLVTSREGLMERTRILSAPDGRQIALADYGPPDARPVLVVHGGMGTRRVGPALVAALHDHGYRPISLDRPGFGLTDMADPTNPFGSAAEDMACALDALGLGAVDLISIDGGAPTALAFARRWPDRVERAVLVAPRPPRRRPVGMRLVDHYVRACTDQPGLIVALYRTLRRRAGVRLTERIATSLFSDHPTDRALLRDPGFVKGKVAELLTCGARTAEGLAAEQTAYPDWVPQTRSCGGSWLIITGDADPMWRSDSGSEDYWSGLPGLVRHRLPDGGRFLQTSHASIIAERLSTLTTPRRAAA